VCPAERQVEDYLLEPDQKMPNDPSELVAQLQRALPREFFDPDGSLLDITYVDPEMRISRFMGRRYAGVRNILMRVKEDGCHGNKVVQ